MGLEDLIWIGFGIGILAFIIELVVRYIVGIKNIGVIIFAIVDIIGILAIASLMPINSSIEEVVTFIEKVVYTLIGNTPLIIAQGVYLKLKREQSNFQFR